MSKHKNKKRDKMYSRSDFIRIICNSCGICKKGVSPTFCYALYAKKPKTFMKHCFKGLVSSQFLKLVANGSADGFTFGGLQEEFMEIFCLSELCGSPESIKLKQDPTTTCSHAWDCIRLFNFQLNNRFSTLANETFKIGNLPPFNLTNVKPITNSKLYKKAPKEYICKPYPTFFSNDSGYWDEKIRKVLYKLDEDNDIEQDKTTKSAAGIEGTPDFNTES